MPIKLSWYKATRTILEAASVIYFIIGAFVFLAGLLRLLWAQTAITSIQAGSYMIAAFIAIATAVMGFIGAYRENFCMIMAYSSIQIVSFAVRTIITMVMVKLTFTKDFQNDKGIEDIPYMISGLPGTSSVPVELLYAVIEVSLATSGFYLAWAVNKKDHLYYMDPQFYYTTNDQRAVHYSNANVI